MTGIAKFRRVFTRAKRDGMARNGAQGTRNALRQCVTREYPRCYRKVVRKVAGIAKVKKAFTRRRKGENMQTEL